MLPSIDIIIVNWNSANQLRECLDSIVDSDRHNFSLDRVVIVDNASTDRSLESIQTIDLPVEVIKNSENKGFGVACNQGATISKSDYILFLNPDARLFKDALDKAIYFIHDRSGERVGAVGIQLIDSHGNIQRNCARFPNPLHFWCSILGIDKVIKNKLTSYMMTDWNHQRTQIVDHVMGAFYLISNPTFQAVNGFDEDFFVYFEDLDLSYRLHQQGFSSYYLANVQSFHKGGGTSESIKATRIFYSLKSRILYSFKHFSWFNAIIIFLASILIEPLTRIAFALIKLSPSQIQETISAYLKLLSSYSADRRKRSSRIYIK
jgi:N-acetylglucosaminyl-diphospho-decaprenol L-rhamnosyltransferase